MKSTQKNRVGYLRILAVALASALFVASAPAQNVATSVQPIAPGASALSDQVFRTELTPVNGGAEIVTIFARKAGREDDLPLLSVLRDTLGDSRRENDTLRYVWLYSYTRPSLKQKLAAFIPFLYARTSNTTDIGANPPPALIDLNRPAGSGAWDTLFWQVFKRVLLADVGHVAKASALQYRENKENYRDTAIATALAVLSVYQQNSSDRVLSEQDLQDIQARLGLKDKILGAHMQTENLSRVYDKQTENDRDERAQNWELMRQMCERQGLIFEPMKMPDGTARHALVWIAEEDLAANKDRKWDGRFLSIKDPWRDKKLANWNGYKEEHWYDADDREVAANTAGAKKRTLI
ncbi:MAG: hypothetical protein JO314_00935, partial [Acidobacteria bacterium]|nr:hypothetical protein [Acidobacteriota bacterium]